MDLEHFAAVMAGLSLVITVVTQLGFAPWQDTRGIVGASDFDKLLGRFLAEPKAAEVWPDQVLKSPCRPAVGALSFGITERRAFREKSVGTTVLCLDGHLHQTEGGPAPAAVGLLIDERTT